MNFTCVICSDQLVPAAEVYVTQCGHIFHHLCLINWIERSKTCPQCRNRTTEKNIHKVYFNFVNTDAIQDDTATLHFKLENVQFQMKLKEQDVKNYTDKYKKVKGQSIKLREEVAELENRIRSSDSATHALKEQLSFYRSKSKENDRLSEEIVRLKVRLKEFENMHVALVGSRDEFNDMLRQEKNVESLALLSATLKKSLLDAEKRKRESDHKANKATNDAMQQKRECSRLQTENSKLKEDIAKLKEDFEYMSKQWNEEKNYMRDKLAECDANHQRESVNTSLKRIITESPIPLPKKSRVNPGDFETIEETKSPPMPEKVKNILESDSPYLPVKACGMAVGYSSMHLSKTSAKPGISKFSIFRQQPIKYTDIKKTKDDESLCYNGLGGTSKVEIFPSPKKQLAIGFKRAKPQTVSSAKFRKLVPNSATRRIDEFVNTST